VRKCESAKARKWGRGVRGTAPVPAALVPGRVNPRLGQRKAPQTPRGSSIRTSHVVIPRERRAARSVTRWSGRHRGIYSLMLVAVRRARYPRPQSTKVDFAPCPRRIHSLPDAGGSTACGNAWMPRPPSAQADMAFSQPRIHSPGGAAGTRAVRRVAMPRSGGVAVRTGAVRRVRHSRPQSTQVDFAPFPRRIHSLLEVDCASAPGKASRAGARRRVTNSPGPGPATVRGNAPMPGPQSTQVDFVWLLQRIHSPLPAARNNLRVSGAGTAQTSLSHSRTLALSHSAPRPQTRTEAGR
jgi:hypothetical protein